MVDHSSQICNIQFTRFKKSSGRTNIFFGLHPKLLVNCSLRNSGLMTNPLDGRNTKKLKNKKTKTADFFVNTGLFSQIVSKKAKIIIYFFMEKSKNNNIILGFSF